MKTEEILRYDRMYQAMREALDADIITFGFWTPQPDLPARCLREHKTSDPSGSTPYTRLSGAESL